MKSANAEDYPVEQVEELYTVLGGRIRTARQRRGLSQLQLADVLGLTRSSMSNVENGKQRILLHNLVMIAQALGVEPAALLAEGELPRVIDQLPIQTDRLLVMLELVREELGGVIHALTTGNSAETENKGA